MKRFRLSTLMLLIVIAALGVGLAVRDHRAVRREASFQARLAQSWPLFLKQQKRTEEEKKLERYLEELRRRMAKIEERSKLSLEDMPR